MKLVFRISEDGSETVLYWSTDNTLPAGQNLHGGNTPGSRSFEGKLGETLPSPGFKIAMQLSNQLNIDTVWKTWCMRSKQNNI